MFHSVKKVHIYNRLITQWYWYKTNDMWTSYKYGCTLYIHYSENAVFDKRAVCNQENVANLKQISTLPFNAGHPSHFLHAKYIYGLFSQYFMPFSTKCDYFSSTFL